MTDRADPIREVAGALHLQSVRHNGREAKLRSLAQFRADHSRLAEAGRNVSVENGFGNILSASRHLTIRIPIPMAKGENCLAR
jgi:hypothetical protein